MVRCTSRTPAMEGAAKRTRHRRGGGRGACRSTAASYAVTDPNIPHTGSISNESTRTNVLFSPLSTHSRPASLKRVPTSTLQERI